MKIVCDACSAKYSIADEKVAGKVFKIRCKKCSNVTVVRGSQEARASPEKIDQKETRVFDYTGYDDPADALAAADAQLPDGAIWHVVIDQEQIGPLSPDEVHQRFHAGELDLESFIWREGFSDWERLDSLTEFVDLATTGGSGNGAAAVFGGPALDDGARLEDPADVFSSQTAPAERPNADGDLFGGGANGGLWGGASVAEPAAAAAAEAEDRLKGQRNENSVLFSLNNLGSLASASAKPVSSISGSATSSGAGTAQAGGQEGSGLIDIRAMASMYTGVNKPAGGHLGGGIADLPVFSQPAIASASPVLMPVGPANDNKKLMIALFAGSGALALIAALLLVMVLKGDKSAANTVAAVATPAISAVTTGDSGDVDNSATATEPAGAKTANDPEDGAGDVAAEAKAENARRAEEMAARRKAARKEREERLANETPAERRKREKAEKKKRDDGKKRREEKATRDAERRATASADEDDPLRETRGCTVVDCLLDSTKACCRKNEPNAVASTRTPLPEELSTSQIRAGMSKARSRVKSCGKDFTGKIRLKVKVGSSGRVSSARASGGPGAVNSCVGSAVKAAARFVRTRTGRSFKYSYTL